MIGPGELIALVSFEGQVFANQAVTREHLGRPPEQAHPFAPALAHWLRRQHVWMEVDGRHIEGVATARPLGSPRAWEIDTLLDAGGEDGNIRALLEQAEHDAQNAGVSMLLLRLQADAPAIAEARRAGFVPALRERLWECAGLPGSDTHEPRIGVREATAADEHGRFQLYSRALPADARRALAMTLEEWRATRDDHWLGRHSEELVAEADGRIVGSLRVAPGHRRAQLELLAAPEESEAARALLDAASTICRESETVLALSPLGAGDGGQELLAAGFEPVEEYTLLSRRIERPVEDTVRVGAGIALSGL